MNQTHVYIKNIENMSHVFDSIDYKRIIDTLQQYTYFESPPGVHRNNFIYFAGVGKNHDNLQQISKTWNSIGIKTINLDINNCKHGDYGYIHNNSIIITTTKSGNTEEIVEFYKLLNNTNKSTRKILIHSNQGCELLKYCDTDLYIPCDSEADRLNILPTCSLTNYTILLNSIGLEVVGNRLNFQMINNHHPGGNIGIITSHEKKE